MVVLFRKTYIPVLRLSPSEIDAPVARPDVDLVKQAMTDASCSVVAVITPYIVINYMELQQPL